MTNKIDLDRYLTKYGQQSAQEINFNQSKSRSRRFNDHSYEQVTYTQDLRSETFQPQQTHYTGFSKSQNQCIEQLEEIKRGLINQERQLSFFLDNYSKKLYDNLLIEHNRIREQILDMLDRMFSESEKRIADIVARENGNEPLEFISIRKRVAQVNQRIDQLHLMLRGENYRKAIAAVVTADFESEVRNIESLIVSAQKNVIDNAVKLVIDQNALNRLRDDIQNLIMTDGKRNFQHSPPLNQPNSMNQRKASRGRLGLFQTAPQPKENPQNSGGFFNFGS